MTFERKTVRYGTRSRPCRTAAFSDESTGKVLTGGILGKVTGGITRNRRQGESPVGEATDGTTRSRRRGESPVDKITGKITDENLNLMLD